MQAGELRQLTAGLSVLLVEDEEAIRAPIAAVLEALFARVVTACNGLEALAVYERERPDLIISDIQMPHMDGLQMARAIRAENPVQPVIFVTAHGEPQLMMEAIALNAEGYIPKPIEKDQFYATLSKVARKILDGRELAFYHHHLEEAVRLKTEELETLNLEINQTLAETISTLGGIAEARSQETGQHVQRVARYSALLAELWGLSQQETELLRLISPMHDVGKLAIPDAILNKPGKLTDTEFELMKTHTTVGYEMLKSSNRPIFQMAAIVACEHHERYDGQGYPHGLAGEAIHPFGRITALADVFDALSSDRVYKKAWPMGEVFAYIRAEAGGHFDPRLCALFFEHVDRFEEIRQYCRGD